jgi:Flp pilus assembly protein TadB
VFRRRSTTDHDATSETSATANDSRASGKGRPTPTRKQAEQARKQRVRPVLTRREAIRRERKQTRAQRSKARQAMMTGDERYFMQRDKGPVRRFLRDYVDSRRTLAEFFLPTILVVLLLSLVSSPQVQVFATLLWLASLMLVVIDLTLLAFRVKREVRKRFPDDDGRGHVLYTIARATQIRKLRMPKPAVKPGTPV